VRHDYRMPVDQRVMDWYHLECFCLIMKEKRLRIVLTCGCFDILHVGHARMLRRAATLGDILVVGLNTDHSIRCLKGQTRPVVTLADRMEMVASLDGVDAVVAFDQSDPRALITLIKPDVYVKGGDYRVEDLVERDTVTEVGATGVVLQYDAGHSSSALYEALKRL
jgi:rfaE bifunctional protein nucleotidyltransferase chain/domain